WSSPLASTRVRATLPSVPELMESLALGLRVGGFPCVEGAMNLGQALVVPPGGGVGFEERRPDAGDPDGRQRPPLLAGRAAPAGTAGAHRPRHTGGPAPGGGRRGERLGPHGSGAPIVGS